MDQRDDDLSGMDALAAKDYIAAFIATEKLTGKRCGEAEAEVARWEKRRDLAANSGEPELASEAERRRAAAQEDLERLRGETAELRNKIEGMKRQLPALEARQRSVDPELLEQELFMAAGRMPGEEDAAAAERELDKIEKYAAAEEALAALKAKMGEKP